MLCRLVVLTLLFFADFALAQSGSLSSEMHENNSEDSNEEFILTVHKLPNENRLVVSSAKQFQKKAARIVEEIIRLHKNSPYAKKLRNSSTLLKITTPEEFQLSTQMPKWTNAIFYKGTIILPIDENTPWESLSRTVRHEYTHALIHNLSGGKCPGWLDEGLAQIAEGPIRQSLKDSLHDWLKYNDTIPLASLNSGFTKFQIDRVVPAYAQSLIAADLIISLYGVEKILSFLTSLSQQTPMSISFENAFTTKQEDFEFLLNSYLK